MPFAVRGNVRRRDERPSEDVLELLVSAHELPGRRLGDDESRRHLLHDGIEPSALVQKLVERLLRLTTRAQRLVVQPSALQRERALGGQSLNECALIARERLLRAKAQPNRAQWAA